MDTIDYKGTSGNDENSSRYWVRGWFIEDSPKEGSNIINGHRVSRFYPTKAAAEAELVAVRKHYPGARVTNTTALYVAGKRDAKHRTEFLAEMGLPPEAELIDGEMRVSAGMGDFLSADYRICTSADCPCLMNSPCYYWQGANDPLHIVIRADAMDSDLQYMAERFHIPVDEMKKIFGPRYSFQRERDLLGSSPCKLPASSLRGVGAARRCSKTPQLAASGINPAMLVYLVAHRRNGVSYTQRVEAGNDKLQNQTRETP